LAVVSAAIIAWLFSADATRALIVNAKASLAAVSWGQPGAATSQPPAPKARSATPVQLAAIGVQPTASAPTAPAAALAPSREEIAAALKTARQSQRQTEIMGQPSIGQPSIATPAAPPARKLDADTLAGMMKRARSLMAIGDIASARLLLERAADAQEASAAFLLGQTYDPAVLGTTDMRSITPDPATARSWYEKAARLGSPDAQQRLAQMRN
jgi:TPR repeat protein